MADDVKEFLGVLKASIKSACGVVASTSIAAICTVPWLRGGDIGVFGGGFSSVNIIEYITISTPGDSTDFGDLTKPTYAHGVVGNGSGSRAVWGGGFVFGNTLVTNSMAYTNISSAGNAVDRDDLIWPKKEVSGVSNGTGDRGVYCGSAYYNIMDYITISSTGDAVSFGTLHAPTYAYATVSNNSRGVIAGGLSTADGSSTYINILQYITISSAGDSIDFGTLVAGRRSFTGADNTTNDRGVFAGGATLTNIIDYITISSLGDTTDLGELSLARYSLGSVDNALNDTAVFSVGLSLGGNAYNYMDYITISTGGNAVFFGAMLVRRSHLCGVSNA